MWNRLLSSLVAMASMASAIAVRNLDAELVLDDVPLEKRQQPGAVSADKFLRRAYHASAIVDKYLYIDGGQVSFINNGTPVYQYSNAILSLDMSKDWQNGSVVLTPTAKPDFAMNLNWGALWYHQSENRLYAGLPGTFSSFDNTRLPPLNVVAFKPDGSGSGQWQRVIKVGDPKLKGLTRPSYSSVASGFDTALALNGGNDTVWFPGLVTFDMNAKTITNTSADDVGSVFWRGQMHFVPVYGSQGIFLALGGTTGSDKGVRSYSTIQVYDPAAKKWYNQTTTGNAPAGRVDACVAGAPSNSGTWEIFVYGGDDTRLGTASIPFDTINILSLPSFHWINVPYNPAKPRHGMTCHAVGGSQILVVGGADSDPKVTIGDLPKIAKSKLEQPDPWKQGLGIFDLQTLQWTDGYKSSPPEYAWCDELKSYYDQNGPPEATIKKLKPDVQALLSQSDMTRVPPGLSTLLKSNHGEVSDASPETSSGTPTGTIVGATVGSVAGIALIALLVFLLVRRRRQSHRYGNFAQTDSNSLQDMYKTGSNRPSNNFGDESVDAPPQYVFKEGAGWIHMQGMGVPAEVDAQGQEVSNTFEADGRQISSGQPLSRGISKNNGDDIGVAQMMPPRRGTGDGGRVELPP